MTHKLFSAALINIFLPSLVLFAFLSATTPASAYFKQEQFYDWGKIGNLKPNVLGESTDAENELPDPGMLPDNPLYFTKRIREQVRLLLTFDGKTKAKNKLEFASVRLAEAQALIEAGKLEEGLRIIEDFENRMKDTSDDFSALETKKIDMTDFAELLEKTTAVQTSVLETMTSTLSDDHRSILEKALSSSQRGMDRAAQTLGEPPVPIDLLARLNSLRGQGLITQEEAASLIQVKSREEARGIFRKYMDQGLIPEADFKRFDSGQAKYFADDFSKAVEMNKFQELVKLEKQQVDQDTKRKVEEFAKTYQPGDIVPPGLRSSWAKIIRLEEVQKTISPDKLDEQMLQKKPQFFEKYQEIKDRVRPTADEVKLAESYRNSNPGKDIPPEYARILSLKEKFGMVKPGEYPPPGHQEAILLPREVFSFKEIPYQTSPSQTANQSGGYDYSTYLKDAGFLPKPTNEPPADVKCPEGSTWNGWICFFPSHASNQSQDFRQPFQSPPPPPTAPGQPDSTYRSYHEEVPGVFVPPPAQNQPQDFRKPASTPGAMPPGQPTGGQERQSPQNSPSCPPGSSWNGSTCHFPPSGAGQQPPGGQPRPEQNNPPPNNPPPNNAPPENNPPAQNNPPPDGGNPPPP